MKLKQFVLLCFSVTFLCVATDAVSASPSEQNSLQVIKNQTSGLISIRANNVPLFQVIEKVSEVTGLIVKKTQQNLMPDLVKINFSNLPLRQAINRLLNDYNKISIQSDDGKLEQILILSKSANNPHPPLSAKVNSPSSHTKKGRTNPALTRKNSNTIDPVVALSVSELSRDASIKQEPVSIKKSLFAHKREELDKVRSKSSLPLEVSNKLRTIRPGYPIPEDLQNDPELARYMQEYGLDSLYDLSYVGQPRGIVMQSNQNRRRFLPPS